MKVSENTSISMPIRNMLAIVAAVAIGVWAYFGVIEKLNIHTNTLTLIKKDLESNSEFRIKYPRGELGQSQNDLEQFMLIEDLYKSVEKMEAVLEKNMENKVNIQFLQKQVEKIAKDIEKLKDADRDIKYTNGNGGH